MSARGGKRPGAGRPKGKPNRVTADARVAISQIIEGNVGKVQGWLDRTAKKKPDRALDLYIKLAEFGIPKLGRVEHTGPGGGPMRTVNRIELVDLTSEART